MSRKTKIQTFGFFGTPYTPFHREGKMLPYFCQFRLFYHECTHYLAYFLNSPVLYENWQILGMISLIGWILFLSWVWSHVISCMSVFAFKTFCGHIFKKLPNPHIHISISEGTSACKQCHRLNWLYKSSVLEQSSPIHLEWVRAHQIPTKTNGSNAYQITLKTCMQLHLYLYLYKKSDPNDYHITLKTCMHL